MSFTGPFLKYAFLLSLPIASTAFAEKTVTFCVDQNIWFPYIMTEKSGEPTGAIVDMAKEVLAKMKLKGEFKSTPWSRCTSKEATAKGEFDGIISPSYKKARAEFIEYPPKADAEATPCSSEYNAVCAKYVFVIEKGNKFEYTGKAAELPQPVRAPNGYSVVADINEELKKAGKKEVDIGTSDQKNLQKLARDGTGVAVLDARVAENLMTSSISENKEFKEKLRILEKPYVAKSNYIAFYKSSKNLNDAEKKEFWTKLAELLKNKAAIKKIYDNPDYDNKNIEKYNLK